MTALSAQEVWRFDQLSKIGGHAVTVEGNPRIVDSHLGKVVQFDGDGDALFFEVHPLAGASAFTWEVIFRPDCDGKKEQRFFHLQENGSQTRILFETRVGDGKWYLDSFAFSPSGSKALMDSKLTHPCDAWYHVASVYDGTTFRNYVNGVLQGQGEVKLTPQGAGRTSAGVRINRVDYFKGALHSSRFTKRALRVNEFWAAPKAR
jgi:Concanavalin A-like lectin/glucanases superfamily